MAQLTELLKEWGVRDKDKYRDKGIYILEKPGKTTNCVPLGDSNEAKIRVAEYSTILFQQGQPRFVLNLKQLSSSYQAAIKHF